MLVALFIISINIAEFVLRELIHSGFLIVAPLLLARSWYRQAYTHTVLAAVMTVLLLFIQTGSLVPGAACIFITAVLITLLKQLMHGEGFPVAAATLSSLLFQIVWAYRTRFFSYPNIVYTFLEICVTLCIVFLIETIGLGRRDNRSWHR